MLVTTLSASLLALVDFLWSKLAARCEVTMRVHDRFVAYAIRVCGHECVYTRSARLVKIRGGKISWKCGVTRFFLFFFARTEN